MRAVAVVQRRSLVVMVLVVVVAEEATRECLSAEVLGRYR